MVRRNAALSVLMLVALTACVSSRPANPSNVCSMFEERRSWYRAAERTQERWGVPVPVTMAFIYQESAFNARARPARTRLLWVIPWKRPSTARGYAQALSTTWADYQRETGNRFASRQNFADAVDFIGWYNHHSLRRSNIPLNDARNLYLAYHEGHGGYNRGTYQNKGWLLESAAAVERNAQRYAAQYEQCRARLGRRWWQFWK
ncbi:MAG TPA: transglycosylase SLT domain-containing protein [Pseudohongiella sp.]|nr:transglycosylase SLT domain-containing protein [Pseudohongiella sp.]